VPFAFLILTVGLAAQTAPAGHYEQGMALWREGKAGEALPHLMTALLDPELSYYAARQVSLMGAYALPLLYRGLWHQEQAVQRQSAVILGWIADPAAVEPLLQRLQYPDCPLEAEYALRKIGTVGASDLLGLLVVNDWRNPALLDRKTANFARLANSLRLPIDPAPILDLVGAIERELAQELASDPLGHAANARLNLLRFLAERGVKLAAPPLARAFEPQAVEANRVIAEALIDLGQAAVVPLAEAFRSPRLAALRPLTATAHFLAAGGTEAAWNGPAAMWLNDIEKNPELLAQTAAEAAWLSRQPNPLLSWFSHHPAPEVRAALAPTRLSPDRVRARALLKSLYLEKTRDEEAGVALRHLEMAAVFLPDREVESRLAEILRSPEDRRPLREQALRIAGREGPGDLLLPVLRSREDSLRPLAVEWAARRNEASVLASVLSLLQEPEPSEAKRAAIRVAAEEWKRPEAREPLLDLLRAGDPLWAEAARGLGALRVREAVELFVDAVDAGREIDPERARSIYYLLTGVPARLVGKATGNRRFEPLPLADRPPPGKLLLVVSEKTDFRGWVKVEERWEGKRLFRLDEGRGELTLYDRRLYDRVAAGASILILEQTVRQTILDPLDLTESRWQRARAVEALPDGQLAGLEGDELWMLVDGELVKTPLGREVRPSVEANAEWGSASLIPMRLLDRERVRWEEKPPPSGWLRGEAQPSPDGETSH
jgi:hypothetical protein